MTFPLALIFVGVGFVYVGVKGYDPASFFFRAETVPA